jgi:ABC-type sugar transport system ATPase subunit
MEHGVGSLLLREEAYLASRRLSSGFAADVEEIKYPPTRPVMVVRREEFRIMVMVRLHHVTTRYDPRHYHARAELTLIPPARRAVGDRTPVGAPNRPHTCPVPAKATGDVVLDDLSLTILPGETLSVVGPSGCGKSTLLRVIAGLIQPEAGELYFDGRPMQGQSPRDRHIGMVFQNYALYPHMAAQENMGFFWRLRRRRPQEITEQVRQTAQLLGINVDTLLARFPRHLSGGEQQRVAVGRCLSRDPAVFLLDEPFSNLDAHLRERSRREVKKLLTMFGITTVFVTHDQREATAMGDRIAVMREGKIVQVGTYGEMYEDPHDSFVAGFLGDPPISLLACHYRNAEHTLSGAGNLEVMLSGPMSQLEDGQELLLGVRPDHVHLTALEERKAMRGRISHFEPRIADRTKIVYVDLSPPLVAAKVPYETPIAVGESVGVCFDPSGLLLFDAHTHRRLTLGSPG